MHIHFKVLESPKRAMAMTILLWPAGTREMDRSDKPHSSMELGTGLIIGSECERAGKAGE